LRALGARVSNSVRRIESEELPVADNKLWTVLRRDPSVESTSIDFDRSGRAWTGYRCPFSEYGSVCRRSRYL